MKGLMPATTTATDLQRNYKKVKNKAKRIKEPITVLSNNKPDLIVMDYEAFEKLQEKKQQVKSDKFNKKSNLESLAGTWTKEEADEFDAIIEDAFEKVDPEKWE